MVRLRRDHDGCGCVRCREVPRAVATRSVGDALLWSLSLLARRPSVIVVFAAVAAVPLLASRAGPGWVGVGSAAGVVSALCARGYTCVLGRAALTGRTLTPGDALWKVAARVPAFFGALLAVVGLAAVAVLGVVNVLGPVVSWAVGLAGVTSVVGDVASIVVASVVLLALLVKFVFVPEACFAGGYGPIASLRVSWALASVHRRRVVALVAGLISLLGLGVVLNTQLAAPDGPLVLSVRYRQTTVVLRSFGVSVGSGVQAALDVALTAGYSVLFFHQYVQAVLVDGETPPAPERARL